jgi:ligand-binding sensor domain-containing protein
LRTAFLLFLNHSMMTQSDFLSDISPAYRHFAVALCMLFGLSSVAVSQQWTHYTTQNSGLPSDLVYAVVVAPDSTVWFGTGNGLASLKGNDWTVFDTLNSPLPDPYITCLAVDSIGTVWIGTGFAGAAKFHNGSWEVFDTSNSDIPHNTLFDITIGPDQTPWFATEDGVVNYADGVWKNYRDSLIEPQSRSVAFDHHGTVWMGTYTPVDFRGYIEYMKDGFFSHTILSRLDIFSTFPHCILSMNDSTVYVGTGNGLIKFVNGSWKVYHKQDSPLPANGIASLAVSADTVIVGTASGIVEIVGDVWQTILPADSTLPNSPVFGIAVDPYGNRIVATGTEGVVIYNRSTIVTAADRNDETVNTFMLLQIYPNPFNPSTTIVFTVPATEKSTVKVYNSIGQEVDVLFNGIAEARAHHRVLFNASGLAGGFYFAQLESGGKTKVKKMVVLK